MMTESVIAIHAAGITLGIADMVTAAELLDGVFDSCWNHSVRIFDVGTTHEAKILKGSSLVLWFDDVAPDGVRVTPEEVEARFGYVAAKPQQVEQLVDFGRNLPDGSWLLLHCAQGISRSTAAAMIVLMARGMAEDAAMQTVKLARPMALPNSWMLKLWRDLAG